MNLHVGENLTGLTPDRLPPATPGGPVRALFLSSDALGWKTGREQLIRATAGRADIAAVHILLRRPLWMKVLNRRPPAVLSSIRAGHFVNPATTWGWVIARWLAGPLDGRRFDAVHASPQTVAVAAAAGKARYGYALSVSCDTTERQFRRELAPGDGNRIGTLDNAVFAAADLVAPLSRWAADSVVDDYAVDAGRVVVTPPVVYLPDPLPTRVAAGGRPLRIGFVGNDFVRKGGERLLAWHQARWADRGVELHVASADAAGHARAKHVTFHGRLTQPGVMAMLAGVDLLVHPTTRDMSAIVVAEAAALGVPAVASRLAGIPDLIDDGVTGLLIDPADDAGFVSAVEAILFDPAKRAAMSAAAATLVRTTLSAEAVFGRLIDRIVAAARRTPGG